MYIFGQLYYTSKNNSVFFAKTEIIEFCWNRLGRGFYTIISFLVSNLNICYWKTTCVEFPL